MNRILITSLAVLLMSSGFAIAGGGHHHSGHHGSHHGSHFGGHGSHYGGHHYGHSGFGFGLSLGRSYGYGNYGYSYPRSYGYSYPSRYRYYSTPSYSDSYPSCQVQSVPVQPQRALIAPPAPPAPKKKIEPTPQAVPLAPPAPPVPSVIAPTTRGVSVASQRRTLHPAVTSTNSSSLHVKSKSSAALGPQLSATAGRTLISDESVPFIVPIDEPAPVVATGP